MHLKSVSGHGPAEDFEEGHMRFGHGALTREDTLPYVAWDPRVVIHSLACNCMLHKSCTKKHIRMHLIFLPADAITDTLEDAERIETAQLRLQLGHHGALRVRRGRRRGLAR